MCFQSGLFRKKSFRNIIRVANSLDPDQARHTVGPDLGPSYLQSLSADDTSRQRILIICMMMVFSIWLDTINLGWFIVDIKVWQVNICKLRCISQPDNCFYFSKQCCPG